MPFRHDRYSRLRALLRGPHLDADVNEEFEAHLALRMESLMAAGMSAAAARQEALQRFGDVKQFHRETLSIDHSMLREQKRMEIIDTMQRELRQAVRGLARAPGFSLVAVATLALGIGASTAVYTLLDAVVLNPLPYPQSDRLVVIDHVVPGVAADAAGGVATATYFHYGERARSIDGYGAHWVLQQNVRTRDAAFRGTTTQVTANLFELLGAAPALGRFLRAEDDRPGAPIVAVISHALWQRDYGGDPDVLNQTIELEGTAFPIVGVAPAGFGLPDQPIDVWYARRIAVDMNHANWHHLVMLARRKPGVPISAVQNEFSALARELPERFPQVYSQSFMSSSQFSPRLRDLRAAIIGNMDRILWIVLGSVGVVLLIAGVNVANLFLVRNETRRSELAVRSALGAERTHLAVQSLTEGLMFALAAGVLGVWLAYGGLRLLIAIAPGTLPRLSEVHLNGRTIVFATVISIAAGMVFGLLPLFHARADYGVLRESGRGLSTARAPVRVRSALVTAQIALALLLMAAAGLMLRSFQRLNSVQSGIDPDGVLTLDVTLPFSKYNTHEKAAQYWRALSARIETLPGVQEVGATAALPFTGGYGCAILWVDAAGAGDASTGCIANHTTIPGFFQSLGIHVRGRTPTWHDIETGSGAIVITNALARRLFPGQDALGKGLRGNGPGKTYYRVVGVAEDFRGEGFTSPVSALVFFPPVTIKDAPLWGPSTSLTLTVKLRTGDGAQLIPAVRRVIGEIDPSAAVGQVRSMKAVVAESVNHQSFTMVLLGIAGFMALLLSVVGLYGVISYLVSRRRAEIGIRMALGARAEEVGRMIVLQSLRLGIAGIGLGLIGAFFTMRTLQTLLFEVAPTDPIALGAVSLVLLATSALAAFLPALRAARVSPAEVLRS